MGVCYKTASSKGKRKKRLRVNGWCGKNIFSTYAEEEGCNPSGQVSTGDKEPTAVATEQIGARHSTGSHPLAARGQKSSVPFQCIFVLSLVCSINNFYHIQQIQVSVVLLEKYCIGKVL